MWKQLGLAIVALAYASAVLSETAPYPSYDLAQVDTPIDLDQYTLVWHDEFGVLRASVAGKGTGPWFSGVHAVLQPGEKMAPVPDPAYTIENGVLLMSTRVDPVDSKRVEAHLQTNDGRISTASFQYGYLEARIWVPPAKGSHAGLWLLSEEKGSGHAEVDVVETYGVGDASMHAATHIWPIKPGVHRSNSKRIVRSDIYDGYHLYGLVATPTHFIFYYDRKEAARIARLPEQQVPFYLLLSVFGNPTQPVIEQPAVMKVDYIRIYAQKAAPQAPVMYPASK